MSKLIATFFFVGYLRPAPGTWGSAAAILLGYALHGLGGWMLVLFGAIVAFFAGWWATGVETRGKDDHDPSEIVMDEVSGQLIALLPVSLFMMNMGAPAWVFHWQGALAAFLLFRLFDILKPGPIGTADRRGDALGVMLDDVIAGVFAAIALVILFMAAGNWGTVVMDMMPWKP